MSEDSWQAAQNWLLFGAIVGGLCVYYYPRSAPKKTAAVPLPTPQTKNRTPQPKEKAPKKKPTPTATDVSSSPEGVPASTSSNAAKATPPKADKDEQDLKQWVKSMNAARQGTELRATDNKKKTNLRTVKQSSALDASSVPQTTPKETQNDADEDWTHVNSSAGAVDDMLEPQSAGPTSLRITPSQQPTKEKVPRAKKLEEVETKKQRQNRQKKEEQRLVREQAERERKELEEKQRRSARVARGEPAKNGIPVAAKAPASSVWTAPASTSVPTASQDAPLLDTFDGESSSSSYVGNGGSTAATSTASGTDIAPASHWQDESLSGDDALARAREESEPWTDVKTKKQSKRKNANGEGKAAAAPVIAPKTNGIATTKKFGFDSLSEEA